MDEVNYLWLRVRDDWLGKAVPSPLRLQRIGKDHSEGLDPIMLAKVQASRKWQTFPMKDGALAPSYTARKSGQPGKTGIFTLTTTGAPPSIATEGFLAGVL